MAEIVRDHCQPTNIKAAWLICSKTRQKGEENRTYNTPSNWGGEFTAGKHILRYSLFLMIPRSVLLSKMDGEEGHCNATWVFVSDYLELWGGASL